MATSAGKRHVSEWLTSATLRQQSRPPWQDIVPSPRHVQCSCYDASAADLFALGVVMYTLAIGADPWLSTVPEECTCYETSSRMGFTVSYTRASCRRQASRQSRTACLKSLAGRLRPGEGPIAPCSQCLLLHCRAALIALTAAHRARSDQGGLLAFGLDS